VKGAFTKDLTRSIAHSLGRFLAIAAIVALGVGFYAGLRMTAPDMKLAADDYYDGTKLMDIRVVSSMGMTKSDKKALQEIDGVESVALAYESDAMGTVNGEQYAIRVHSLPKSAAKSSTQDDIHVSSSDNEYLNRLVLKEGKWPTKKGECVISADTVMNNPTKIGDKITLTESTSGLKDTFKTKTFKIVGYVHSPYYVSSTSLGATSLGSGTLQQFMYVAESNFESDFPYTEAFISVKGASALNSSSAEYDELVASVQKRIEAIAPEREAARTKGLKDEAQEKLDDKKEKLENEKAAAFAKLEKAKAKLDKSKKKLEASSKRLEKSKKQYKKGKQQLDQLEALGPYAPAETVATLKAQLAAAKSRIKQGQKKLRAGKKQYKSGLASYKESYAQAQDEFDKAQDKIDKAQAKIDDIEDTEWYVMDRSKNYGAESYEADAARMDNIASVFPFIFFLVAALVALTTMTRMVEEERQLIGTFKALGYSRARITSKYIIYAALAGVAGSIVGILALGKILPFVIHKAYSIIYFVPLGSLPIDLKISFAAAGLGVGVTLLATIAAAYAALRERPATLMLPKTPKAGKRILLERIKPLWRKLSFSNKVTCRNMFRYKKRLFMTIIGIAGCTALLLTGLGLNDSINDIIDNQFGPILKYNVTVSADDDISKDDKAELENLLSNKKFVQGYTWAASESMLVSPQDSSDVSVEVIIPKNEDEMKNFIHLQTRKSKEEISLDNSGVVIVEKLANVLNVQVGDTIRLYEQDDIGNITNTYYDFKISGICENYVSNYVYMSKAVYKSVFGKKPAYTKAYASMSEDENIRAEFSNEARAIDDVKTVHFNDETIDAYRSMLKSVGMVVAVLVVAAALLAFIVLYNLTNINITERKREIATLKVLGFLPGEVNGYIYREIAILSIIGALIGLVLGVFLESFVVVTTEVDQVMFGRLIHFPSFVISFALTLVFTNFVLFVMRHKLSSVDMVESLKSVE
jgi:putative ABC transport system permease protein